MPEGHREAMMIAFHKANVFSLFFYPAEHFLKKACIFECQGRDGKFHFANLTLLHLCFVSGLNSWNSKIVSSVSEITESKRWETNISCQMACKK